MDRIIDQNISIGNDASAHENDTVVMRGIQLQYLMTASYPKEPYFDDFRNA